MRVFFSGDSFTWGHNVGDDDTLPAQLQSRLQDLCGAVTVVNGGLSGSTILEEQAMIERGLAVDPTVVVLMYHENDIPELIHERIWEQLALNRARKSRPPLSLVYPLLRRTVAWNLAQEILRARRFRAEAVQAEASGEARGDSHEDLARARKEYRARLDSVANMLAERDIPLLFVAFPHPESVTAGRGGEHYSWVVGTAGELDLPTVDLLEILVAEEVPVEQAYLVPMDYHPSPTGHAFAASRLAEVLSEDPRYKCTDERGD
jgi:lysophospholipase L1-like esterase